MKIRLFHVARYLLKIIFDQLFKTRNTQLALSILLQKEPSSLPARPYNHQIVLQESLYAWLLPEPAPETV